jgi:hypothetical protein
MIRIARVRRILLFAISYLLFVPVSSASNSPTSLIEQDVGQGIISEDDATVYRAFALVRPAALPTRYRDTTIVPGKCATGEVRDAMKVILSDPDQYATYKEIMSRPTTQAVFSSARGYFWLHYDTTGINAVPLLDADNDRFPDFVERAGAYADSCWRYDVSNLGHLPPPYDATLGGGMNKYDIYFQRVNVYGYTQAELPGPNAWNDYSSHIVVHCDFAGFPPNQDPEGYVLGALKVTIAHEFYHAVQFAYDVGEAIYFMEQSSTCMEEMVFPEVNDNYNYLPYFYNVPQVGLQATGEHEYAAFIWPKYLQERFGATVLRDIWVECRFNSAIGAWSRVLDTLGSSLEDEFVRFLIWNYHTGDRATLGTFASGADYPQVHVMRYSETIPDSNRNSIEPPESFASNYIVINNYSGLRGILTFDFTGMVTATWGLGYIVDYGSGQYASFIQTAFQGTKAKVYIPYFENVLRVIFIPAVTSSYGSAYNYSYHLYWRLPGDISNDGLIDMSDVVAGIQYIFGGGTPPEPLAAMDANCDGSNDISDVTYLIGYIFGGGPAPCR